MPTGIKITFEEISENIESEGCKLLSQKSNIKSKDNIEIQCSCGNIFITTYDRFMSQHKTTCEECSRRRTRDILRKDFDNVLNDIETAGYIYISGEYLKRTSRTLIITDNSGYYYKCSLAEILNSIKTGGRLEYVSKVNPYTIYNIKQYLNINNKRFSLISEFYSKALDRNLEFECSEPGCGERWTTSWAAITTNQGCPFCVGKKVGKSNSFGDTYPEFLKEWDYNKNEISPFEITLYTHYSVWWKCSVCDFEWKTTPGKRVAYHTGCPSCNGKVVIDKNRLSILYPELVKEWNFEKNNGVTPDDVSYASNKKFWWTCTICHNDWIASICSRTNLESGCPNCSKSKGEERIFNFLVEQGFVNGEDIICQARFEDCKNKNPLPYDFYITRYNICIEFHGKQHFEPIKYFGGIESFNALQLRDQIKLDYCRNNNIPLLIIPYWEYDNIEQIIYDFINNLPSY